MDCPVCKTVALVMSERQGIEIDYCPQCRGVWLDRGELDKIIERSMGSAAPQMAPQVQPRHDQQYTSHGHRDSRDHDYNKKKKREGFLGDIFDFD